jgi:hypothetical protein
VHKDTQTRQARRRSPAPIVTVAASPTRLLVFTAEATDTPEPAIEVHEAVGIASWYDPESEQAILTPVLALREFGLTMVRDLENEWGVVCMTLPAVWPRKQDEQHIDRLFMKFRAYATIELNNQEHRRRLEWTAAENQAARRRQGRRCLCNNGKLGAKPSSN